MNRSFDLQGFKVIVLGGDHYNTYGVIRSLGEAGISPYVFLIVKDRKHSYVVKSRYAKQVIIVPKCNDLSHLLLENIDGDNNIVICCSDEAEELILEHYEELSPRFILPVCRDYHKTKELMNKMSIGSFAQEYGISVPRSWVIVKGDVPYDIDYPCITKPLYSVKGGKEDIVRCDSPSDLEAVLYTHSCTQFLVQEYVPYEKEVSILGAALPNGDVIFSGCIDKIRTCMIGTSSFAVMNDNLVLGDNLPKLRDLIIGSGYRGLFSAEFLLYKDVFYFLEVNFRNDGNAYVSTASGVNLPFQYVLSFIDPTYHVDSGKYPCYFMLELEDLLSKKRNHVSLRQWFNDVRRTDCFLVYDKKDKAPFIKKCILTLRNLMGRIIEKI